MKIKDKEFIKEIVSSDFKYISNHNFNCDTLEKIMELENSKVSHSNSGDITFLIPQILYTLFYILFSLITVIISWLHLEQTNSVMHLVEIISNILLHPVTVSILFSFSLLYLVDLYIKKLNTKITKPNVTTQVVNKNRETMLY